MKFKEYLNESGLSRVWKHMQEHDSGTITAFRYARDCRRGEKYTKGENKARNKVLLAILLKHKFSVTKAKGVYIENYKKPDAIEVGENVFIVVDINDTGKLKKVLLELGEKFDQDSVLFIPKGGNKGILTGTNKCENGYPGYGVIKILKHPIFGEDGEMYTKVNGRPFILKEGAVLIPPPGNNNGKWAMNMVINGGWELYYDENKEILESEGV